MKYSDEQRLDKIISIGKKLLQYLSENQITKQQVLTDYTVQWTVTTPLYNIGEQVYNLSNHLKESFPSVSWNKISGLRHRFVHDYEGTNWNIIVQIIFSELSPFIDEVCDVKERLK